ncbi:probable ubiquitin-conjugating enzyme E2 25 isoform X2 [Phragmites australis]|uniref:probable ubiquitin-conjugating enzyme E2 25 isoform X2 n=1 Tax=Phragmites australis TaxID=29695 RepID=UPI002D772C08|nr:probable ubiquitin-conjugating enzyme E2 25 isoform X2 [Phragmites australis]
MDAAKHPHMQGGASSSLSSCRAADYSAACDAVQQQKRQRCQGSSSNDQVGSSTENNSLQASGPELDYGENEEEDYYFDDEDDGCYDDEGSDYELDIVDYNQQLADKFDDLDLPPGVEATVPWLQKVERDEPGKYKSMSEIDDEIAKKYNFFKQFDTVEDFLDHHYAKNSVGKARKEWAKRIQHDWNLLEKDLPALIYVRVSENRMDLLRAAMIGPQGTPYHDGLFFFDVQFSASYPATPPVVYYHSGGLRLNPNLYNCGKVCLSLLGTWEGHSCEKWNPAQSTMLQVLISIQALVLNEKPYFNEPGYERSANSAEGQRRALEYNDTTFQHSCRTMLYSLRRPPQHFEDLVAGHFRERGRAILAACKYYMKGHEVGSRVPEEEEEGKEESKNSEGSSSSSAAKPQHNKLALRTGHGPSFKPNLEVLFEELLMEFNVKGADTAKFRAEKLKNQPAPA